MKEGSMTLPLTLTFVRHGLSEANRVQSYVKSNRGEDLIALINVQEALNRHDSTARLSLEGVRQAQATGEYLRSQRGVSSPERFYVSPHVRTRETAAHLGLEGEWIVDDRFRERDWGEVANPDSSFKSAITQHSMNLKKMNEWYWKPAGGESLATGVRMRVESVLESLHRRGDLKNVIAVTHGEFIRAAQFVIEKLTPDQFLKTDSDPAYKVHNTMVLEYSRINPEDSGDIRTRYHWRRAVCLWDSNNSWDNGKWVEFSTSKFSDKELLDFAESHPRYFLDDQSKTI